MEVVSDDRRLHAGHVLILTFQLILKVLYKRRFENKPVTVDFLGFSGQKVPLRAFVTLPSVLESTVGYNYKGKAV